MGVSSFGLMLLAALSGVCLSLIGVAFKIGQGRGVIPLHISMCMGIAGAIVFGSQMDWHNLGVLPLFVWGMVLLTTLGQLLAMHLVKICLRMGPLSPLWAAMNLTFLPVILYSALFLSESIRIMEMAAIFAGILTVVFASQTTGGPSAGEGETAAKHGMKTKLTYSLLLVLVLMGNSLVFIVIKDLGTRTVAPGSGGTWLAMYIAPIYFLMYASLALFSGAASWMQKARPDRVRDLVMLGALAAAGSIAGLVLLKISIPLPAALVFTLSGVMTIVSGAVASVVFFREPVFWAWYGTVGFGVLAVLLANLGPWLS